MAKRKRKPKPKKRKPKPRKKEKPLTAKEIKEIIKEEEKLEAIRIVAELNLDLKNQGLLNKDETKTMLQKKFEAKLTSDKKIELSELELGMKEVTKIVIK